MKYPRYREEQSDVTISEIKEDYFILRCSICNKRIIQNL